ncbi:hypothetical protein [Roseococcus sp.]|uniref:hypothetical protein n=1 Tax=Roseococcus sp. TaxID=2109646 RepID=UPI003BAA1029
MPSYEPTRKGNPNQLPIRQHVFPRKSIERFTTPDGIVSFQDLKRDIIRPAAPNDTAFCAMRAWTRREETGFMQDIEAPFQALVDSLLASDEPQIPESSFKDCSRFYALWEARALMRELPSQEEQLNGVAGDALTKEQEENLESNGYGFVREGGRFPTRQLNGLQLMVRTDWLMSTEIGTATWGIIKVHGGELLVPDTPVRAVIPITPTMMLAADTDASVIDIHLPDLIEVNKAFRASSKAYLFARSLSACP